MSESIESNDYQNRMIEAFVGKPSKTFWYQNAFSKFSVNGVDAMKWNWSWWGFFGGFLFLLYRKAYIPALVLVIVSMTLGLIPFVGLLIVILAGGYSTYFIYKVYKTKLLEIESTIDDEEKRIETMAHVGGYNQWVVWLYVVFVAIIVLGVIAAIIVPKLAS